MASTAARNPRTKKMIAKKPIPRMLPCARVSAAVRTLAEPSGAARFAAGKALAITAQKDPGRLYPYFGDFAAMLDSECKIVRWNAMQILVGLAAVDEARKVDAVLDSWLSLIAGTNMITAANAIRGAARIAVHRPELIDRIAPAILGVERADYETPECRNVAIGHALEALEQLWPAVGPRPDVAAFISRQQSNPRAAVARRARRLAGRIPAGDHT